jgi:hypothetical protein
VPTANVQEPHADVQLQPKRALLVPVLRAIALTVNVKVIADAQQPSQKSKAQLACAPTANVPTANA